MYQTAMDEVFFLKEYRDHLKIAYQARKDEASAMFCEVCQIKERLTWSSQYDKSKFEVEPLHSMVSEVTR